MRGANLILLHSTHKSTEYVRVRTLEFRVSFIAHFKVVAAALELLAKRRGGEINIIFINCSSSTLIIISENHIVPMLFVYYYFCLTTLRNRKVVAEKRMMITLIERKATKFVDKFSFRGYY